MFFFSSPPAPPGIYTSFPTRRSSDLAGRGAGGVVDRGRGAGVAFKGELSRRDFAGPGLDRKSTRLNSSHVSISYAVFCLKKKTRQAVLGVRLVTHSSLPPPHPRCARR